MLFIVTRLRKFSVFCLLSAGIYLSFATLIETRSTIAFAQEAPSDDAPAQVAYVGAALLAVLALLTLTGCKDSKASKKKGQGLSESECRILINSAKDNPTIDVPEACKEYEKKENGNRIVVASSTNAYDMLNEAALDLRHFAANTLKLKATVKTGEEKRPNGSTVNTAATFANMLAEMIPGQVSAIDEAINDLNGRLVEINDRESGQIAPGDILLLNASYQVFLNKATDLRELVSSMNELMVFENRKVGELEESPAILSVSAEKSELPSRGGKVKVEVVIDDSDSMIEASSVMLQIFQGGKKIKELSTTEDTADGSGMRKFKATWNAPKNLKLKAAKYALKAVGEKSDKSASISSEDRGGTVTVKGKR